MLGQLMTNVSNAIKHRLGEKMFAENLFGNMYMFSVQAVREFLEKMEYSADMYSLEAFIHYYQVEVRKCDSEVEMLSDRIDELEDLLDAQRTHGHMLRDQLRELETNEHRDAVKQNVKSWSKAELLTHYLQLEQNSHVEKIIREEQSRDIRQLAAKLEFISSRHGMEVARLERRIQFLEDRIEYRSISVYTPNYSFKDEDIHLEEVVNIMDGDAFSDDGSPRETSIFIAKNWLHKAMLTQPSRHHSYAVGFACPLACSLGTQFCEEHSGCLPTWIGMSSDCNETVT